MKGFLWLLLLPCFAHADDCTKLASFMQNQERKLQGDYMAMHVQRKDWVDFLRASDVILKERYDQRVAICRQELANNGK